MGETRLLFYSEGLTMTGYVTAVVAALVFLAVLLHGVIRSAGSGEGGGGGKAGAAEPILPMWQVTVGLALAALVFLMTWVAAGDSAWQVQLTLMGLVMLACGVWVLFFYLRVFNYLGRLPMAGLLAMRLVAILLLVLLIFKPVLSFEETLEHRTDLYLLVDASESMSVSDYPDTPHRLSLAARQIEEYLGRLKTAFEVKLFWFDTRAHEVQEGRWPSPEGDATNLARAVKDVLAAARMIDTSGVILMSDGLHNAGGDVVKEIAALGPPRIYTVGIGTDLSAQSGYQDISIENVRAPEESTVNNIAKLTVDVEAVGLADRGIQVELREADTPLASAPLRLDAAPGSQSVTLTFTPETVGRHTYTVRIRPDPAERRSENNQRDVHLLVTDPKIRVLYIEGVVRPEYKPLKSVLETDPNVELLALVQVKRGEFLQSGSMTGVTLTGFPQTLEDMRKFDVYIVGDLDRSYFSRQQLDNLKTAIAEGRGIVMIGGYNSFGPGGYEGTAMEEILPVAVGPRGIGQETTPFVLRLTPEGANHAIFHGTKDFFQYQSDTPRQRLPYLRGCNILARAKPGASILAEHPERTGADGPLTVLATHTYGEGRAAAFAADTTYQWYLPFKAMGRESPYIRFWGQMVRWLANKEIKAQSDEPGVDLLVRKPYYNPGEKVLVRAKVRAEEGRATNFATTTGALRGPANERRDLSLALVTGSVGVYETTLEALDPGTYKVLVEAKKEGVSLGKAEAEFTVGRPNQEFDRLSINRPLLKQIAQATGADYYEPAAFGDLVGRLRDTLVKEPIHREVGIQTVPGLFPILFVLLVAVVTGEWLLRKYYQLN
jgi:uncharacterized membrane protein